MEFDFINNLVPNESERAETNKMFVSFIKSAVSNVETKDFETETDFSKTKELETKIDDLMVAIKERFFRTKQEPYFEDTTYEIYLNKSQFSPSRTTMYSETYRYNENDPSKDFVERMTGHTSMDGTSSNHATETHEVGKEEMVKMLDFVKQKLESH